MIVAPFGPSAIPSIILVVVAAQEGTPFLPRLPAIRASARFLAARFEIAFAFQSPTSAIIEHAHFSVKRGLLSTPTGTLPDIFEARELGFSAKRFTSRVIAAKKYPPKVPATGWIVCCMDSPVSSIRRDNAFGLRERNKRDKLRRIKDAATELFLEKGFDDTTTRAIALRAGVGLGTIFVYAPTKRDLLFLIINEELQTEVDRSTALVQERRSLLDNLMRVFRAHYRYFGQRPTLSRLALREMMFYAAGPQAQKFLNTRERLIALIETAVTIAIDKKEIAPREDAKLVAWVIFSIYQIEIRHWLSSNDLDLAKGTSFLRRQLILFVEGLAPRRAS